MERMNFELSQCHCPACAQLVSWLTQSSHHYLCHSHFTFVGVVEYVYKSFQPTNTNSKQRKSSQKQSGCVTVWTGIH